MSKEIIPISLSHHMDLTDGEKEAFSRKRNFLISHLYCAELSAVASTLNQDSVYKLVMTPEGAKLYKDAQGNLKGVFYKDGKIVGHAKLQKIGPSILEAAKAVGTQFLLINISMQLNRIEKQVTKIFKELHADRLAEIEAGKSLFQQACNMIDPQQRKQLALAAVAELTRGFEKTVSALKRQIDELPNQKPSIFDNWFSDKSKESGEKNICAAESFFACITALQTITRCHLFLDERDAALKLVNNYLVKIENAGINVAYERSRLAPKVNGLFPEECWGQFIEYRKSFNPDTVRNLIAPKEDLIELEIKPSELKEEANAKV